MAGPREVAMVERFTPRARRAVVLATEEARSRGHESIEPEHLLMGILRDGEGMAVKVLERLQVPETLRAEVERLLSETPGSSTPSEPGFSAKLKAVLQAAVEARLQPNHVIGPENLLLGLLAWEGSEANGVLHAAGVNVDAARSVISLFYNSMAAPITAENLRFIATSKWRGAGERQTKRLARLLPPDVRRRGERRRDHPPGTTPLFPPPGAPHLSFPPP